MVVFFHQSISIISANTSVGDLKNFIKHSRIKNFKSQQLDFVL